MKKTRKPLCIMLVIMLCMSLFPSVTFATEEPLIIDVSQGRITIEPDGYTIGEEPSVSTKVPYTGAYILTGTGSKEIYFKPNADGSAYTYDVSIRDLKINSEDNRSAITIFAGITVNMTVEGDNHVKASNHPGVQYGADNQNDEPAYLNITMQDDSRLELDRADKGESDPVSVNEKINVNVTNSSKVSGLGFLADRKQKLILATGNFHAHEPASWTSKDKDFHQGTCAICEEPVVSVHNFGSYTSKGKDGHEGTCLDCGQNITQNHKLKHQSNGETYHFSSCRVCDYHSENSPHQFSQWYQDSSSYHRHSCTFCEFEHYEKHSWNDGETVESTPDQTGGILYTCTKCGATKLDASPDNALKIQISKSNSDIVQNAALLIYRDGKLWRTLSINNNDYDSNTLTKTEYLPYDDDHCYVFEWQKGWYNACLSLEIYLPGDENAFASIDDLAEYKPGNIICSINGADYENVNKAISEIPQNLEFYTTDSLKALFDEVDAVNWHLGKSSQQQVNAYAENIRKAIKALVSQEESSGYLYLNDKDLFITKTGYSWDEDGEEIPYTGNYILTGNTGSSRVLVKSGTHSIELRGLIINSDDNPFSIANEAKVDMLITEENKLISNSDDTAGLSVPDKASLHILKESTGGWVFSKIAQSAGSFQSVFLLL